MQEVGDFVYRRQGDVKGPLLRVLAYSNGPLQDWYESLDAPEYEEVTAHAMVLEQASPLLGRPCVDIQRVSPFSPRKELRAQSAERPLRMYLNSRHQSRDTKQEPVQHTGQPSGACLARQPTLCFRVGGNVGEPGWQ